MKPSIPKGTRDFGPVAAKKRRYIFNTIEKVFRKYGFEPIETPAMELLQTLTGKYGEEGDALLFKVLNNGDYLQKADEQALESRNSNALTASIARRGLRYDLTVPFARFVAMHQHEITFPFKRYQIQPVWRADRPQKGRYQEFYQCDVDIIGSAGLLYEAELICIYDEVFSRLNLPVTIRINHRRILQGIADYAGISNLFGEMTTSLDKLDKIGRFGVQDEMIRRNIPAASAEKILSLLLDKPLNAVRQELENEPEAKAGFADMDTVTEFLNGFTGSQEVKLDLTLARGLNYYTGFICEVLARDMEFGSIGGGGRYDDLTGVFGLKDMSGVGVSFGAERIYDVMDSLGLFPEDAISTVQLILLPMESSALTTAFRLANDLRAAGFTVEAYPEAVKFKKQMKYANDRNTPLAGILGTHELEQQSVMIKTMETGVQELVPFEKVKDFLDAFYE